MSLTNEKLGKKFTNPFDLINYAIGIAKDMMVTGRDPRVKTDIRNRAVQVLMEIEQGKEKLEEVEAAPEAEVQDEGESVSEETASEAVIVEETAVESEDSNTAVTT